MEKKSKLVMGPWTQSTEGAFMRDGKHWFNQPETGKEYCLEGTSMERTRVGVKSNRNTKKKFEKAVCLDQLRGTNIQALQVFQYLINWGNERGAVITGVRTSDPIEWVNDSIRKVMEENKDRDLVVFEFESR